MTEHKFSETPTTARVWIYGAERVLGSEEVDALNRHMDDFLREWRSHGREIEPSWTLVHDQFLVIGVDETAMGLSGCSIDSMFHAVEAFGKTSGLDFSRSGNQVFYRDSEGQVCRQERFVFSDLARQGAVGPDTIVFNNTITTVGEFRSGQWELPMRESWHMKAFGKSLQST